MTKSLGKPIAAGYTAELYSWQSGWVIKLFRDWVPADWVEYEAGICRDVYALGYPVPAVGDVVEVNNRRGILFEKVEGLSYINILMKNPFKAKWVGRELARLHAKMHKEHGGDRLPFQSQRLTTEINKCTNLIASDKERLIQMLSNEAKHNQLCHNDFHPDNIIVSSTGPVVIDWMNAARGNPVVDAARTLLLLQIGVPTGISKFILFLINTGRRKISKTYLKTYCRLSGMNKKEVLRWLPVVAAARLSENHAGEEPLLLKIISDNR